MVRVRVFFWGGVEGFLGGLGGVKVFLGGGVGVRVRVGVWGWEMLCLEWTRLIVRKGS